ncbi:phosphotyrosine protein phosphatase [Streptococcus agalactiae LMG 14747]|uniref:protein-tyrosine-phosphatase n=1 Tax=Streptococcus agalactiae LMG 14747 TaxID=1154860 RepID=V6Z7X1_STRAG|nr:phosphotyrosine protein phosphatase [Streptococcus agalactiae LMG 14747]
MKKVCFVCLGNICRSPMAEFVMKELVGADWQVESRATSSWEHGNPIHTGTQSILQSKGYWFDPDKTSQQVTREDLVNFDVIIGMDNQNVTDLRRLSNGQFDQKIHLFCKGGVPDPWYTGNFEETYAIVYQGCRAWLETLS